MPATPITLADGATTLELPTNLHWQDEFTWQPVEQTTEYSITGALLVHTAERLAGRPFTLVAADDRGWITRAQLDQLNAWAQVPYKQLSLTLRNVVYTVVFRHHDGGAIQASALLEGAPIDTELGGIYICTIRLMEI